MSNTFDPSLNRSALSLSASVGNASPLRAWMLLLLALVATAAYANSLANGFAFDDIAIVRDNPHVQHLDWTAIWTDNYWPRHDGQQPDALYRPLTLWSYLANQALAPQAAAAVALFNHLFHAHLAPDPAWWFHLVNVLLHALVSVLVALLAQRIFGHRAISLVAGLLFAVHPLHTEAVANTVGRAEILAATWSMLTLLVFLPQRPLFEESAPQPRAWGHGVLVALCFFAAMLSKETPAVLLVAVVVIDGCRWLHWHPSLRPTLLRWFAGQALRYYLPMGLLFGLYLAMRIHACGLMTPADAIHPIVNLLVRATPGERIITPFALLAKYLALTFWPVHLAADYSAPSLLPTANPLESLPLAGILVCVLALITIHKTWRKTPQLTLVIGLFFCSYALVANVIRIGTIFGERLFYWPSAFVLMLVAWVAVRLCSSIKGRTAVYVPAFGWSVVAALCFVMSVRTYFRNADWQDNVPLAISTAYESPNSAKACYWAGSVLVMADRQDFQTYGVSLLKRAIELCPDFSSSYWEIAKYYGRQRQLGKSVIYLAQTARLDPGSRDTRLALGAVLQEMSVTKPEVYMPILEQYRKEHSADPAGDFALALAYHAQKDYDQAEKFAKEALGTDGITDPGANHDSADPRHEFHEAAAELAAIQFDRGHVEQAVDIFRQYVTRIRSSVEGRCRIAEMLLALDPKTHPTAITEAEYNLSRAAEFQPDYPRISVVRTQILRARRVQSDHALTADARGAPAASLTPPQKFPPPPSPKGAQP